MPPNRAESIRRDAQLMARLAAGEADAAREVGAQLYAANRQIWGSYAERRG